MSKNLTLFFFIIGLGINFTYDFEVCYVCVRLCIRVSVCSLLRQRLNIFLPPLPEIECPKVLEIRNSWGKVMERRCLRFEFLPIQGVRSLRKKKFIFGQILLYLAGFCWYWCFSLRLTVFLPPLPNIHCPNFLDFRNPLGKVMERNGLILENFCS